MIEFSLFINTLGLLVSIYMSYVVWSTLQLNLWKWALLMCIILLGHILAAIIQIKNK